MAGMVIDGLQFARSSSELVGVIDATQLPRLAELQCRTPGIRFRLRGGVNERGKPALDMALVAELELTCQRCMQPLAFALNTSVNLELSRNPAEIESAEDDVDRILAKRDTDVAALVEDEAILALPMIPRHEHCEAAPEGARPSAIGVGVARASPFGALAALRQGRKKR